MSDEWAAYNAIGQYRYQHFAVNHSENFVDPTTKANGYPVDRMSVVAPEDEAKVDQRNFA